MGLTVEALYERILVKILAFERGVGHFERKFQGKGVVHQRLLALKKLKYLCCVVRVILRLAVLIQYRRVTDRHIDRQTGTR